jgi:CRISPR system Cascade subunit CasB
MALESKQFAFIGYLEKHAEDRAMLATLRRGLGKQPGESASMYQYIIPFLHEDNVQYADQESNYYLIASLFALHPISTTQGNMGAHLYQFTQQVGDDEATTRRFVQLLNLRRETLDTPLRQHISLLKSKDIAVNWHQLFYDIRYWSHEDRFVQKQWASKFWRSTKKQSKS